MGALDNIHYLIEALRGGDTPNRAAADRSAMRSSSNTGPTTEAKPGQGQGMKDPEYSAYVAKSASPKPYMKWVEEGE